MVKVHRSIPPDAGLFGLSSIENSQGDQPSRFMLFVKTFHHLPACGRCNKKRTETSLCLENDVRALTLLLTVALLSFAALAMATEAGSSKTYRFASYYIPLLAQDNETGAFVEVLREAANRAGIQYEELCPVKWCNSVLAPRVTTFLSIPYAASSRPSSPRGGSWGRAALSLAIEASLI